MGVYPDPPGPRMAYDRDGSVGFRVNTDSTVVAIAQQDLEDLNDESTTDYSTQLAGAVNNYIGIIFPELRDLVAYWIALDNPLGSDWTGGNGVLQTSDDTTTGLDGTWTNQVTNFAYSTHTVPEYRTDPDLLSVSGIKAIRFRIHKTSGGGAGQVNFTSFHLYGTIGAGQTVDRLRIWQPVTDAEVDGAYFNFGDIPRATSHTKQFRVKNNSATLDANDVALSVEALTDTSPTMVSQLTLSDDDITYASTLDIGTLAPGEISDVLYLKLDTLSNSTLSVWAQRLLAEAGSWT